MSARSRRLPVLLLFFFLVTACSFRLTPRKITATTAVQPATPVFAITKPPAVLPSQTTQALKPTATKLPATPTVPRTPPALPPGYVSSILNAKDSPHTYIKDVCTYLKMKWDPNNAAPGTVVMPIMYHSITDGNIVEDNQIHQDTLKEQMKNLKDQGFQTITSEQLANFLERNAYIPMRSVILILDDRRPGAVRQHFMPYLEDNKWTLTLSFLIGSGEDSTDKKPFSFIDAAPNEQFNSLWEQMEFYNKSGRLDIQAHGFVHNINITENSTEEFIHDELYKPIAILEQHFGKRPIAYIWPGGSFTKRGIEVARQAGYRLGFTVNPRGPVMFNWIPQSDAADPARPSYIAEGPAGDPVMTLPRYWDTDASNQIDNVRIIGKEAAAYAQQVKPTELEYYDIVCSPVTGPIPTEIPKQ